ncbi:MAG TPA: hypothetical protein VKX39_01375 [Bryobacteraceae bacterium]|nr:hypothetical protein [Bryobacteraceae bacterium]
MGARCPDCGSELPIMREQAMLLADGDPVWLFCPVCTRIVRGERIVHTNPRAETSRAREVSAIHGAPTPGYAWR